MLPAREAFLYIDKLLLLVSYYTKLICYVLSVMHQLESDFFF